MDTLASLLEQTPTTIDDESVCRVEREIDCAVDLDEPICAFRRRRAEAASFQIPEPVQVCPEVEARPDFGRGRPVNNGSDSDSGSDSDRRILSKKERRQRRNELRSRRRSLSSDSGSGCGSDSSDGGNCGNTVVVVPEPVPLPVIPEPVVFCESVIPLSDSEIRVLVREYRALCAESQLLTLRGEEDASLDEWFANTALAAFVEAEVKSSSTYDLAASRLVDRFNVIEHVIQDYANGITDYSAN